MLAALELKHGGLIGRFGNADHFFVEAQSDADVAHLILQRFDNFAVDEFEQARPALDQHDRNSQRGEDTGIFAANDASADDRQGLRQLFERKQAVAVDDALAVERNPRRVGGYRADGDHDIVAVCSLDSDLA